MRETRVRTWVVRFMIEKAISSGDKNARVERFHGHSDEPQEDLSCSKHVLLDPIFDVEFVVK